MRTPLDFLVPLLGSEYTSSLEHIVQKEDSPVFTSWVMERFRCYLFWMRKCSVLKYHYDGHMGRPVTHP